MPKLTAWDTYDGYIADKRKGGATLEEIGKEVGVTRERIRQILMEHYGTTKMTPLLTTRQLSQLAGLSVTTINIYHREGIIKPTNTSVKSPLYSVDALKAILDHRHRQCRICGKPVPIRCYAYCSPECHKEGDRRSHNRSSWRVLRRKTGGPITSSIAYERRGYG